MRHLYGLAMSVVLAAAIFFGGAWGYLRLLRLPSAPGQLSALPADGGSLLSHQSVIFALAAVVATGLFAGILAIVPRISPLAAGLPGLALTGWTVLYLGSVHRAVELIPLQSRAFGAGFVALGMNGVLGAAGLVLVVPLFVPSRWRRPAHDEAEADAAAEYIPSMDESDHAPTEQVATAPAGPPWSTP